MFGKYKSWILVILYVFYRSGGGESVPTSKSGHCDTVALSLYMVKVNVRLNTWNSMLHFISTVFFLPCHSHRKPKCEKYICP